jgi:hypothetical protein
MHAWRWVGCCQASLPWKLLLGAAEAGRHRLRVLLVRQPLPGAYL